MHYVIVGAGPAGVVAAETLSKVDPQGEITLLDRHGEPRPGRQRRAHDARGRHSMLPREQMHVPTVPATQPVGSSEHLP